MSNTTKLHIAATVHKPHCEAEKLLRGYFIFIIQRIGCRSSRRITESHISDQVQETLSASDRIAGCTEFVFSNNAVVFSLAT